MIGIKIKFIKVTKFKIFKLPLILLLLIPALSHCQQPDSIPENASAKDVKEMLADGYTLKNGFTFQVGDTLYFGKGTMPDHSYAFIYQNPINLSNVGSDVKHSLTTYQAKRGVIKDIFPYGTKKSGFTIIAKIGIGSPTVYWIELDNAVESGELMTKPNH